LQRIFFLCNKVRNLGSAQRIFPEKKIETRNFVRLHQTSNMASNTFSATMSRALEISMTSFAEVMLGDAVKRLANKYGFNADEATEFLLSGGVHVKLPPLEKSKLPWCGSVDASCCKAIVKNAGLFTQCTSAALDGGWCKKCAKDVEKNGTPANGDVEARLVGDIMAYKVGKTEVKPYIEYMMKNGITREQVEEAVAAHGLTIDPRQFEKKKRGRKNTTPRTMAPAVESPHPGAAEDDQDDAEDEESVAVAVETVTTIDLGALHRERLERSAEAAKASLAAVAPVAPVVAVAPVAPVASVASVAPVAAVAPVTAVDPEEVEDDRPLTIKDINEMKKEDVHRVCAMHGINIDGKNILELKKALKATVK